MAGCGASNSASTAKSSSALAPSPRPAFGLTEDNAALLWSPDAPAALVRVRQGAGGASLQAARLRLTALHPAYVRLLVNWAALQPSAARPAALEARASGCARGIGPCAPYAGVREELEAIASQQRAAASRGEAGFQVVVQLLGVPQWAAGEPSGCEFPQTFAFSRPINEAGIAGYRALIRSLLALGAHEGVALRWWSPWNEPNDPVFVSPQRPSCAAGSPSVAPATYAELARAAAAELRADGGEHHLLLGELNAFQSGSPHRTSIAEFVAALPAEVICLGDVFSIHAYARYGAGPSTGDAVKALEVALDARGRCGRSARIWVTEAGAGAPHPGQARPAGAVGERAGCRALARQLLDWHADPRVGAVFQYSFREDPAFPVGLMSADLSRPYPAYRLWLSYTRALAAGRPPPPPPPPPAAACA